MKYLTFPISCAAQVCSASVVGAIGGRMMSLATLFPLSVLLLVPITTARASLSDVGGMFDVAEPVALEELAVQRGGFADPSGLIFRFAVDVHAQIDGTLTFVRSFLMAPDQNGQLQTVSTHDLQTGVLPAGSTVTLINGDTGVLFQNSQGQQTHLLSQTVGGMPSSIVSNTVNDVNIGQTVNVDIALQNMQGILDNIAVGNANTVQQNIMQTLHDTQIFQ